MDEDLLRASLHGVDDEAERLAIAAGTIAAACADAEVRSLVISGGAAVAIYTGFDFATRDIDVVTDDGESMDGPLRGLGFTRKDHRQIWEHATLGLVVQVADSRLPRHSDTTSVHTAAGEVLLWSATDLIVDRLANAVAWKQRDRVAQALALRFAGGLDEIRGRQRAKDDGVEEAFDAFLALAVTVDDSDEEGAALALSDFWRRLDPDADAD